MVRALFGGSFDPVHVGHTALVTYVLDAELADIVHVVPAWHSPFKSGAVAAPADRLRMARLAFDAVADVVVESLEISARRPCFTIDTLVALQDQYAADEWLLLIGADNLAEFSNWHEARRLQELATVVVLGRNGIDLSARAVTAAGLAVNRFSVVPDFVAPVSSSAVRAMLAAGADDLPTLETGGVPARVARYILAHRLYLPASNGEHLVPDPD